MSRRRRERAAVHAAKWSALTEPPADQRCELCEWPNDCEAESCLMQREPEIAGECEEL